MTRKWVVGFLGLVSCAAVGMASAAEPAQPMQSGKPMVLTVAQMDTVTAGGRHYMNSHGRCWHRTRGWQKHGWGQLFSFLSNIRQVNNNVQIAIVIGNNNTVTLVSYQVNGIGV